MRQIKDNLSYLYQRNYDWRKDNCKTLFDDIVNAVVMDRLHFVGSIVYVDQGEENKIYRYLMAGHFSGHLRVLECSVLSTLVDTC